MDFNASQLTRILFWLGLPAGCGVVYYLGGFTVSDLPMLVGIFVSLCLVYGFVFLYNTGRQSKQEIPKTPVTPPNPETAIAPPDDGGRHARQVEQAIKALKDTKGAEQLPRYVVAGPPDSGKTSFLISTDVHFDPLSGHTAQNLKTLEHPDCVWRKADAAVLIDTPGTYFTDDSDSRASWKGFIATLAADRGHIPFNGLLVVVDAFSLLTDAPTRSEAVGESVKRQWRNTQATLLRQRVEEAEKIWRKNAGGSWKGLHRIKGLLPRQWRDGVASDRTPFPVRLIFTNLDQLEGFKEFFRPEDRAESWGVDVPFSELGNSGKHVETQLTALREALGRTCPARLAKYAEQPEKQLLVFNFPARFGKAVDDLLDFVNTFIRGNNGPLLSGVHFTSSPSAHTSRWGMGQHDGDDGALVVPRGFFTGRLLEQVLKRDAALADVLHRERQASHAWRYPLNALVSALMLFFSIGLVLSFFNNRQLIGDVIEQARRVDALHDRVARQEGRADASGVAGGIAADELDAIEGLREKVWALDQHERMGQPLWGSFGLYTGGWLTSHLRAVYFESIYRRLLRPTFNKLESRLGEFPPAPADGDAHARASQQAEEYYNALRAYLMLSKPDASGAEFLSGQLESYWPRPPDLNAGQAEKARAQLRFFATQAGAADAPRHQNAKLIAHARQHLKDYGPAKVAYARILSGMELNRKPTEFAIPGGWEFEVVPASYSIEGHREFMSRVEAVSEEVGQTLEADAGFKQGLEGDYLNDYLNYWRNFLAGAKSPKFDRENVLTQLEMLSKSGSPIEKIIELTVRHTDFSAQSGGSWLRRVFAGKDSGNKVEEEFRPIFKLATPEQADNPMSEYRTKMSELHNVVIEALKDDKKWKDVESKLDDISRLVEEKIVSTNSQPSAELVRLLNQPLGRVRAMNQNLQRQSVEDEWRKVSERARQVGEHFVAGCPFSNSCSLTVDMLNSFLNPTSGELTLFVTTLMSAHYLEEEHGRLKSPEQAGDSSRDELSPEFVDYLNAAWRLRQALFTDGEGKQPMVRYRIELKGIPGNGEASIEIDDNGAVTSRGQGKMNTWPVKPHGGSLGAVVSVKRADGSSQKLEGDYGGEWGVFKLFRAGGGEQRLKSAGVYELTWQVGDQPVSASLKPSSDPNLFQRELYSGLGRPPQSPFRQ